MVFLANRRAFLFVFCVFLTIVWNDDLIAATSTRLSRFQRSIIDYRGRIHPNFKKIVRKKTKYIVVHTSEAGLKSTLNVVLRGKLVRGRRISYGGHANYVIARDGRTFRTLDKRYRADHAGRSMWKGEEDISSVSIGIELVGYHYTEITDQQYRSLGLLIKILEGVYHLNSQAVLTHSQVAYGRPNRWFRRNHRGRKRCAKNFIRYKAGLGPGPSYDPDVRAGRLSPDPKLAAILYARRAPSSERVGTNIITAQNSAWTIAGGDYNASSTLYKLPNGKIIPGDEIEKKIGWKYLPKQTIVMLNQPEAPRKTGPIKTISNGQTAWTLAGAAYNHPTTFYFFPNGKVKNGGQISDWDELPTQTKMIVGYRNNGKVSPTKPPGTIAGRRYKDRNTIYYFPDASLVTGNIVKNFKRFPAGVQVYLPVKKS
ncbi:MAG: N-acetylmuramoyl-L-alanine amidase [Chloroflexi bacterium]|nr:MAG: N-acetylmuramoyl-L-alanine amidase [Chloroflexota bacterium]